MSQPAIAKNQQIENAVGIVESLDIAVIFTLFLKESWHLMLDVALRYPLFLLAGTLKFGRMLLAIREAWLSGGARSSMIKMAVEILSTAVICPTVAIGLFGSAALASFAPLIFTITVAAESFYRTVATGVYWWYSNAPGLEVEERQDYQNKAKGNAIGAVLGALSAMSLYFVMIKLVTAVAVVGAAAALFGAVYGMFIACSQCGRSKANYDKLQEDEPEAVEFNKYGYENSNTVTALMRNGIASPRVGQNCFVENGDDKNATPSKQNGQPSVVVSMPENHSSLDKDNEHTLSRKIS